MKTLTLILYPLMLTAATINIPSSVGNGTTDATTTIQAAFRACMAGDTVFFPAGVFSTNTLKLPTVACRITAKRASATLKARAAGQDMFYAVDYNDQLTIENLVFDMNFLAATAAKFDWQLNGIIIRYNVFKNGGSPAAVFLPDGSQKAARPTQIVSNIFLNTRQGIYSYGKFNDAQIDSNYFNGFDQAIGWGGCDGTKIGNGVSVSGNTFLNGKRMALEVCGAQNGLAVKNNFISQWRPSDNPAGENYPACGGAYPYMCDSMAISIATGGAATVVTGNVIDRQPGTSWGFEYTVLAPDSLLDGNIIKNASTAIFDEACSNLNATNCDQTRQRITNNYACGGVVNANNAAFSKFPASNRYFSSCSDPEMKATPPLPKMPFDPITGADSGGLPPLPAPVITSFTAAPASITAGQGSLLSWTVTGATSLSLSGIGAVTGSSRAVTPAATTAYTLTATNSAGSTSASTTVTVAVVPPPTQPVVCVVMTPSVDIPECKTAGACVVMSCNAAK